MDIEELLAAWRAAEAAVEAAAEGSEERAQAEFAAEEARLAYHRRVDELRDVGRELADEQ